MRSLRAVERDGGLCLDGRRTLRNFGSVDHSPTIFKFSSTPIHTRVCKAARRDTPNLSSATFSDLPCFHHCNSDSGEFSAKKVHPSGISNRSRHFPFLEPVFEPTSGPLEVYKHITKLTPLESLHSWPPIQ